MSCVLSSRECDSIQVKLEILKEDDLTPTVNTGEGIQVKTEFNHLKEVENPVEELANNVELPRLLVRNPFAISRRSKQKRHIQLEFPTGQDENISTSENQTRTPTPLSVTESKFILEYGSENMAKKEHDVGNIPVQYCETINDTELIIKSEVLYGSDTTSSSELDDYTRLDTLEDSIDMGYSEMVEEYPALDDDLVPHSNGSYGFDEYSKDMAPNVLANSIACSVRIVNVSTLVEEESLLRLNTQPLAASKETCGRPKTDSTANKIQNKVRVDKKDAELKNGKYSVTKKLPYRSGRANINYKCMYNKSKNKKTRSMSTKCSDFPQPLKLEAKQRKNDCLSNETDVVTVLPCPIVFKHEPNSIRKYQHSFRNWRLQPLVRLKRLSRDDLLKANFNSLSCLWDLRSKLTTMQYRSTGTDSHVSIPKRSPYRSPLPRASRLPSYSYCDSGASTSGATENSNLLLEIAAERAFINNHLKVFGFSPIQFALYNNLDELCIFLKYLFGKLHSVA